jgi:hypothetical protein
MIVERQPWETDAFNVAQRSTRGEGNDLQLMVGERFRPDEVLGDIMPLHIQAARYRGESVHRRNNRARKHRGSVRRSSAWAKANTRMDDGRMEAISEAVTASAIGTLVGKRTRHIRPTRRTLMVPACVTPKKGGLYR